MFERLKTFLDELTAVDRSEHPAGAPSLHLAVGKLGADAFARRRAGCCT
jgi:hypothetical protein